MFGLITTIVKTVYRSVKRAVMWTLGIGPDWAPDARPFVTISSRIAVFGLAALAFVAVLVPSAVSDRAARPLLFAAQSLWAGGNTAAASAMRESTPQARPASQYRHGFDPVTTASRRSMSKSGPGSAGPAAGSRCSGTARTIRSAGSGWPAARSPKPSLVSDRAGHVEHAAAA